MKKSTLFKLFNFYPPLMGAGVRLTHVSEDLCTIDVEMKLRFWNRNYVRTHFGGSLYAMVDPFYMLIVMENLGQDYLVWDKSATINFKRPGTGTVRAHFHVPREVIEDIRRQADENYKVEPTFTINVTDTEGNVIAEVEKLLYIRRRDRKRVDKNPPKSPL